MSRRYKIGEQPEYDRAFDHLKGKSPFLNPKGRTINEPLMEASFDPDSLLAEWLEKVPKAQAAFAAAVQEFEKLQAKCWRCGRPVPENEPPAIRAQRLRAEAKVDVTNDEVATLRRLAELKRKAEAARKAEDCLPHGPRGVAIGEPIREIDGQAVIEKDGELIISCQGSQYDGLALPIYHQQIVLPFLLACRKARKETGRADAPWPKRPEA